MVGLLTTTFSFGLYNALGALIVSHPDQTSRIYSNTLYIFLAGGIILSLTLALISPLINAFTTGDPIGLNVMRVVSAMVLLNALNILSSQVYRLRQKPNYDAIFDVTLTIGRLLAVLIATQIKNLQVFAIATVLIQGILTAAQIRIAYNGIKLYLPDWILIKRIVIDGFTLSIVSQAEWIIQYGDRLLLSILSTSAAVAVYSASYQPSLTIIAVSGPFLYALLPMLAEKWNKGEVEAGLQAIRKNTRFMTIIVIPTIVGLSLIGDNLLVVLATPEFAKGNLLIAFIAIGTGLGAMGINLHYIYHIQQRLTTLRNIFVCTALFNILANLVAIPLLDYYGAGITTFLTFALTFYLLWKYSKFPFTALFDIPTIWRCLLACIPMGLWAYWVADAAVIKLVLAIAGGILFYGVSIILLNVLSLSEIMLLLRSLQPKRPA